MAYILLQQHKDTLPFSLYYYKLNEDAKTGKNHCLNSSKLSNSLVPTGDKVENQCACVDHHYTIQLPAKTEIRAFFFFIYA